MFNRILLLLSVSALASCASNSGVMSIGKDTYMVSRQAATGFTGSGTLKADAFQEANSYCEQQGKVVQVVNTTEAQPPFIFGNFPKAEIQFMCLDKNDAELNRPKLQKTPNSVVEVKQSSGASQTSTTDKLKELDSMHQQGLIDDGEYAAKKKAILDVM